MLIPAGEPSANGLPTLRPHRPARPLAGPPARPTAAPPGPPGRRGCPRWKVESPRSQVGGRRSKVRGPRRGGGGGQPAGGGEKREPLDEPLARRCTPPRHRRTSRHPSAARPPVRQRCAFILGTPASLGGFLPRGPRKGIALAYLRRARTSGRRVALRDATRRGAARPRAALMAGAARGAENPVEKPRRSPEKQAGASNHTNVLIRTYTPILIGTYE